MTLMRTHRCVSFLPAIPAGARSRCTCSDDSDALAYRRIKQARAQAKVQRQTRDLRREWKRLAEARRALAREEKALNAALASGWSTDAAVEDAVLDDVAAEEDDAVGKPPLHDGSAGGAGGADESKEEKAGEEGGDGGADAAGSAKDDGAKGDAGDSTAAAAAGAKVTTVAKKEQETGLQRTITIDIGGQRFVTTARTLMREPGSVLAALTRTVPPVEADEDGAFFFDRDWWLFRHILRFLRDGAESLTTDTALLREIHKEAGFWGLASLKAAIKDRLRAEAAQRASGAPAAATAPPVVAAPPPAAPGYGYPGPAPAQPWETGAWGGAAPAPSPINYGSTAAQGYWAPAPSGVQAGETSGYDAGIAAGYGSPYDAYHGGYAATASGPPPIDAYHRGTAGGYEATYHGAY